MNRAAMGLAFLLCAFWAGVIAFAFKQPTRVAAGAPCDCAKARAVRGDSGFCAVDPAPLLAIRVVKL